MQSFVIKFCLFLGCFLGVGILLLNNFQKASTIEMLRNRVEMLESMREAESKIQAERAKKLAEIAAQAKERNDALNTINPSDTDADVVSKCIGSLCPLPQGGNTDAAGSVPTTVPQAGTANRTQNGKNN